MELVIAGVLHHHAGEAGLRSEDLGGNAEIKSGVSSLQRIDWIVTGIADIAEIGHAHTYRLGKQRYKVGRDHQVVRIDAAIDKPVEQGSGAAQILLDGSRTFQTLGRQGAHVIGLLVKSGQVEGELRRIPQPGRLISDQCEFFQVAIAALEGERVIAPAKVEPGDIERYARAYAGLTLRVGGSRRLPGLHLEADTVVEGIATRLSQLEVDVLMCGFTVRILNGYVDLVENPHVIKTALGIKHLALAEAVTAADLDFTLHDERSRVVETGDENPIDKKLRPFGDLVGHVDLVGIIDLRLRGVLKFHLGKAEVEITVHHIGLVVDDHGIRVRLAFGGGNHPANLAFGQRLIPLNGELAHGGLRTFVHGDNDADATLLPVVVIHLRRYLHLEKAVVAIEVFNGLHIAREDRLAEQAIQQQAAGRLLEHALAQVVAPEIMIALDIHLHQLVALVAFDAKDHIAPLGAGILRQFVRDVHVKIAFALHVIADIARAFIQQVVIHSALFVNRDQLFHLPAAQLCPLNFNFYDGAAIDVEGVIHKIGLRVIDALRQGDLGLQAVLFLIVFAQALQRRRDPGAVHLVSGTKLGDIAHFFGAQSRRSGNVHLANARRFAVIDGKKHLDLLGARIPLVKRLDGGLVIAVLLQ